MQTLTFDDVWKMFQKSDRKFRKVRKMSAETERMIQTVSAQMRKTDIQMKETDRKVKEVSIQIGNLGGRWGAFVEGLVAPASATLFAQRGIPVHKTSRNIKATLPGNRHMEIDVLVINTNAVVLVEVKSHLTADNVREHMTRLAEFKLFFPEYAEKQIFGAVAGIVIESGVDRFAMNQGLFVIVQSGEVMQIANAEGFVPQAW